MSSKKQNEKLELHREFLSDVLDKSMALDIPKLCADLQLTRREMRGILSKLAKEKGWVIVDLHRTLTPRIKKERKETKHKGVSKNDDVIRSCDRKIPEGSQKFMCKCRSESGILYLVAIAKSKEATQAVLTKQKIPAKVLEVYTMEEYVAVRTNLISITGSEALGGSIGSNRVTSKFAR